MSGALVYLDQQIDAIRQYLPAALAAFDQTAIHQSRVGTRRIKAGFDVLEPLLADLGADRISLAGKRLRRRLGPLRDLDVMIDHLGDLKLPPRLTDARAWTKEHFEAARIDARADSGIGPRKIAKATAKFDDWWRIRHALEGRVDAFQPLLTEALHSRFNAFADLADRVAGIVESPEDAPPIDVHELRIDGKAVRYAFELASAHGLAIPKKVSKTFKAMQDALGDWHDQVVLADRILRAVIDTELALHRSALAASVLEIARVCLQMSERSLAKFNLQWKKAGDGLRVTLADRVPLTVSTEPVVEPATVTVDVPEVESASNGQGEPSTEM